MVFIVTIILALLAAVQLNHAEYTAKSNMLRGERDVKRLAGAAGRRMTQPCTLVLRLTQFEHESSDGANNRREKWECELDPVDNDGESGFLVDVNIDFENIQNDPVIATFESGVTKMNGDSIYLHGHHAYAHEDPSFETNTKIYDQRHLQVIEGTKTVLVLRAKAADAETSLSTQELALKIFGIGGEDELNLSSGYEECSYGQLKFVPTEEGSNVQNGVLDLVISNTFVENAPNDDVVNAMLSKAMADLGVTNLRSIADYTIVCIPPGTQDGWVAYAYVGWWLSVYNDNWCRFPSVLMHELGHNIGLLHSNENGEYQDTSGMMGYSFGDSDDKPRMCFNSAKNYQLGWFIDKEEVVNPSVGNWTGPLIGYDDYQNPDLDGSEKIVLTVEGHELNFHVGFNLAKGLNADNEEAANKVLIQSRPPGKDPQASELVAKLGTGDSYEINGFAGGNIPAIIKVISIDPNGPLRKATISVMLDGCTTDDDCDDNDSCTIDTCDTSTQVCNYINDDDCASPLLKVAVKTDGYPAETSWSIIDHCDDDKEILSGTYDTEDNYEEKSINVPLSRYSFKIMDSYGDGMCCNYGDGMYKVTYANETVAEGGQFGYDETSTWGYCDTATPSQSPTRGGGKKEFQISIRTDGYPAETSWKLVDICDDNNEVFSKGGYTEKNKLHDFNDFILPSKYMIVVKDAWGDGICCQHGQGSYEVHYDGNLVAEGGRFESSEAKYIGEEACPSEPTPTNLPTTTPPPTLRPSISSVPTLRPSISPVPTNLLPTPGSSTPSGSPPTDCDVTFNLTLSVGSLGSDISWNILYDEDHTVAAANTTMYMVNGTYVESGCLEKTCYRFNIMSTFGYGIGDGSYSLEIDGIEIVESEERFYYEEATLFGTCNDAPLY